MRRDQLTDAQRGVELLLGCLKGTADCLNGALEAEDAVAASACADPLVTVATILIRMLRTSTNGTISTALALARPYVPSEIPGIDVSNVEQVISALVAAKKPPELPTSTIVVALVAESIAFGAATELATISNRHINAVVADLRTQLKNQGDEVQLSDRDSAETSSEEYAADSEMRLARQNAARGMANYFNHAASIIHEFALLGGLDQDLKDSLEAVSLITVTCAALTGGICQLAEKSNLYPASSLLRQLVEAEFILWKFAQEVSRSKQWLNSTPAERREHWRPSKIYRDDNNDYRQKDYTGHCELCGHPTPAGTRIAAGVMSHVPMASLLCDLINHSRDAWQHLIATLTLIDRTYSTTYSDSLTLLDSAFWATMRRYAEVEQYGYASAFYADPVND